MGVEAFADALLVVPKTLADNAGLDTQDVIISLQVQFFAFVFHTSPVNPKKEINTHLTYLIQGEHDRGNVVGLNQHSGDPIDPQMEGIFDNYSVKRQIINSGYASISCET